MLTISAPGKVHLVGEHAVVYGEPAIISAIGLRTTVKFEKSELDEVMKSAEETVNLWESCSEKKDFNELFNFIRKDGFSNYRKSVIGIILKKLEINNGVTVNIDSNIPVGSGLASSASLAVSLVKGIAELNDKNLSLDEINEIAFELEKIIHGTPSGGDNSTCCFGGLVWFQKSQPNIIIPLKEEIPYKLENFVIVYTKPPEKTTGELVQLVRNLDEEYRNERVKKIGTLVREMREVLKNKKFDKMKEIINENQKLLAELGVSCKEIDEVANAVMEIGGAAKLSGAGGGGAMLCYHEDKEKLIETIKNLDYKFWDVELAVDGVKIENQ